MNIERDFYPLMKSFILMESTGNVASYYLIKKKTARGKYQESAGGKAA